MHLIWGDSQGDELLTIRQIDHDGPAISVVCRQGEPKQVQVELLIRFRTTQACVPSDK